MVESIARDKNRLLPCAAWLEGEYQLSGVYCGVPCVLSRKGLERIVQVELTVEEAAALRKSANAVKETMAAVKL
jgi:malate dehydrogenase